MLARVLGAMHDTVLDDTLWPQASALIDDACGTTGNTLVASEGFAATARVHFRACYCRGVRNEELEEDYFRHTTRRLPGVATGTA